MVLKLRRISTLNDSKLQVRKSEESRNHIVWIHLKMERWKIEITWCESILIRMDLLLGLSLRLNCQGRCRPWSESTGNCQNRWPKPARAHACSRHRFHCIDLFVLEFRSSLYLPLSSRTGRLNKAGPAQAVTMKTLALATVTVGPSPGCHCGSELRKILFEP